MLASPSALAAGRRHSVGRRWDGAVLAVGNTAAAECRVERWEDVVAVTAGNVHTARDTGRSHTVGLRPSTRAADAVRDDLHQTGVGATPDEGVAGLAEELGEPAGGLGIAHIEVCGGEEDTNVPKGHGNGACTRPDTQALRTWEPAVRGLVVRPKAAAQR